MDVATLAAEVAAPVREAVRAYHTAALIRDPDAGGDPTVEAGREILQTIYWRVQPVQPLETAVDDLASQPDSEDALAELRLQISKALTADATLREEVTRLRPSA